MESAVSPMGGVGDESSDSEWGSKEAIDVDLLMERWDSSI
jgi:hypothetical protein